MSKTFSPSYRTDTRGGGNQAEDRPTDGGLSTSGFTDQPERFTGLDLETHTIDRADLIHHPLEDAAPNREMGLEIVDLEQRTC